MTGRIKNTPEFRTWLQGQMDALSLLPKDLADQGKEKCGEDFPDERTIRRWLNGERPTINAKTWRHIPKFFGVKSLQFLQEIGQLTDEPSPEPEEDQQESEKASSDRKRFLILTVVIPIALVVLAIAFIVLSSTKNINRIELSEDGTVVFLLGENGKKEGEILVGSRTVEPLLIGVGKEQYIVVGVREENPSLEAVGHVIAYDVNGKEKWRFGTFDANFLEHKYRKPTDPKSTLSGYFIVDWLTRATFFGEDQEYIVVLASDPDFAPTRITVLEPSTGTDVYTFWNSGAINSGDTHGTGMKILDLDGDGSFEIIVSGFLNKLTATINRKLNMPSFSQFWRAAWMIKPTKRETACAPALACSQDPFEWLVLSYPPTTLPTIEPILISRDTIEVKIGDSESGLYFMVNYEGKVTKWFRSGEWADQHGDDGSPPLFFLKSNGRDLETHIQTEHAVDPENAIKRFYEEQEFQRIQEFLKLF